VLAVQEKTTFRAFQVRGAVVTHAPQHHARTFVALQTETGGEKKEHVAHCLAGMHHEIYVIMDTATPLDDDDKILVVPLIVLAKYCGNAVVVVHVWHTRDAASKDSCIDTAFCIELRITPR